MPVAENVPGSVVANGELWSIGGGEPFTPFTTTGVVSYNPTTDTLTQLAEHDPARFNGINPSFNQDEESSGVIDVTSLFNQAGKLVYLLDTQAHFTTGVSTEVVEKGQLQLMVIDRTVNGTSGNDTFNGTAEAESYNALAGNDNLYLFNDNSVPIKGIPITLTSHVGYSSGSSALAAGDDYIDWGLGATAAWKNLTLGVSYVDTNINEAQALSVGAARGIVDSAIVVSLGATF